MKIRSARQLKDWVKNYSKELNINPSILLQNYIMERFLERVSLSKYKENLILKGGFLIASIIGVKLRSTRDIDATIKGLNINRENIEKIIKDILLIDLDDNVKFEIIDIKNIRDISEYDDYRISLNAKFYTIKQNVKIDITTSDLIIPKEIKYKYKLLFEDRKIEVLSYNVDTIIAEKIESLLVRNVTNTRARDFYDIYILFKLKREDCDLLKLKIAITKKSEERKTMDYVKNYKKYLNDIKNSDDMIKYWEKYSNTYRYAKDIEWNEIIEIINKILTVENEN